MAKGLRYLDFVDGVVFNLLLFGGCVDSIFDPLKVTRRFVLIILAYQNYDYFSGRELNIAQFHIWYTEFRNN